VRYPNVYGIDMPAANELIAHNRNEAEVAEAIGADHLIFQDLADLEQAVRRGNSALRRFDTSCFTGEYVTGDIDRGYLDLLEQRRSDVAKAKVNNKEGLVFDLQY
jgi:amidophosphoribosyltransferase